MQEINIEQFQNSSGWHVVHNADTNMYYIKSAKGHKFRGCWTTRRFADKVLYDYLEKVQEKNERKANKKK